MTRTEFVEKFTILTGHPPFPWQRALYGRFAAGDIPPSCNIPTGLGKTAVIQNSWERETLRIDSSFTGTAFCDAVTIS